MENQTSPVGQLLRIRASRSLEITPCLQAGKLRLGRDQRAQGTQFTCSRAEDLELWAVFFPRQQRKFKEVVKSTSFGVRQGPTPGLLLCDLGQVSQHLCSLTGYVWMGTAVTMLSLVVGGFTFKLSRQGRRAACGGRVWHTQLYPRAVGPHFRNFLAVLSS